MVYVLTPTSSHGVQQYLVHSFEAAVGCQIWKSLKSSVIMNESHVQEGDVRCDCNDFPCRIDDEAAAEGGRSVPGWSWQFSTASVKDELKSLCKKTQKNREVAAL